MPKNANEWSRWPRGRYNGKRIVGASIKFKFSVQYFEWRPHWIEYAHCLRWMWFYFWIELEYELFGNSE